MKRWRAIVLFMAFSGRAVSSWAQDPTVAPGEAMTDIVGIKPPIALAGGPMLPWILAGVLLAIAILAVAYLLYKKRKRRGESPPPAVPPHQAAERDLGLLAGEDGLSPREFYFRLSAILRGYLEGGFGLAALEMTMEELLPRVDALGLPTELAGGVKALSRRADPVKFAGLEAAGDIMDGDLAFVRRFVEETRPREDDV